MSIPDRYRLASIVLTLGFMPLSSVSANNFSPLVLPPETRSDVNGVLSNSLNALHVFSSSDSVSSGYFSFDADGGPDTDIDVLKLRGDYHFGEGKVRPFVSGLLGSVNLQAESLPIEGDGENDRLSLKTQSIGVGGGVDWEASEGLHIIPKMMFIYSRSSNTFDYNNEASQTFLQPFDGDLFNWDVDTMTYIPSLRVLYNYQVNDVILTPSVQYSHITVDSFSTNSGILDVRTDTDIIRSKLSLYSPLKVDITEMPLGGEIFAARSDLFGDASDVLEFSSFHEVGFLLSATTAGVIPVVGKVGVGASYTWNEDFRGWRIGLEGEL